jgi:hypothetical protein
VGSIPIARSINPVDAVGLTGFHPQNSFQNARFWTQLDATLAFGGSIGRDHTGDGMSISPMDSERDLDAGPELEALGLDSEEIARRLLAVRQTPEPAILADVEVPGPEQAGEAEALEGGDLAEFDEEFIDGEDEDAPAVENESQGPARIATVSISKNGNRGAARRDWKTWTGAEHGWRFSETQVDGALVKAEAAFCLHLVDVGAMTVQGARELIAVGDDVEASWRTYAEEHPADCDWRVFSASRDLRWRIALLFERLLASRAGSTSSSPDRAPVGGFYGTAGLSTGQPGLDSVPSAGNQQTFDGGSAESTGAGNLIGG